MEMDELAQLDLDGTLAIFGGFRMTGAGKGLAGLGIKLASTGLFKAFTRDEEHFDGNATDGDGDQSYGEKKNLHVSKPFFYFLT